MNAQISAHGVLPNNTSPCLNALPEKILMDILKYILPRGQRLAPRFKCGMMLHGARSECLNDDGVSKHENIDAVVLRASRTINHVGTLMLYAENSFYFDDAETCEWWLRTIGDTNLRHLQQMTLIFKSGWFVDEFRNQGEELSPFDRSYEETWFRVLCCLEKNTRLAAITIVIHNWKDLRVYSEEYSLDERRELWEWRKAVFDKLKQFRGIKTVAIEHMGRPYLSDKERHILRMVMSQPLHTLPRSRPAPKMSLEALINECRYRREERERGQLHLDRSA